MAIEVSGRKVGHIPLPEEQSFAAMHAALSQNCNLWDGGEFYGPSPEINSLTLLRKYFDKYPEDAAKVVLNIKGALRPGMIPDGSPEFVRQSVDRCIKMLGDTAKINMFECACRDPNVRLEITLATLREPLASFTVISGRAAVTQSQYFQVPDI